MDKNQTETKMLLIAGYVSIKCNKMRFLRFVNAKNKKALFIINA